jgi:hypothetical protein
MPPATVPDVTFHTRVRNEQHHAAPAEHLGGGEVLPLERVGTAEGVVPDAGVVTAKGFQG